MLLEYAVKAVAANRAITLEESGTHPKVRSPDGKEVPFGQPKGQRRIEWILVTHLF